MHYTVEPERPYEYDATRIDIYIAALLQGAVERGVLSFDPSPFVSPNDQKVIKRIVDIAKTVSELRDVRFYGEVPK